MLYLVPVPIIIIAATVLMVAKTYKLKLIGKLSKVIIAVGVVFFIHFFAVSKGFNIIDILIKFFTL